MNYLPLLLAFALCLISFSNAESTTKPTVTQKKTRTVEKDTAYAPKQLVNSPTNFGFVPVKTSDNYIQKEPLGRYVFPDLLGQTQAYVSKYPSNEPQINYQQLTQYAQQQSVPSYTQQHSVPSYNIAQTHAGQQYVSYPQQYSTLPAQEYSQNYEYQYSSQPQAAQYNPEPLTKNVNYIADHSVPQYVYLQQPSNAIDNVIGSKDQGFRYIMLIPNYVPQQTVQNYYVSQPSAQDYTTASIGQQQPEQVQYVYNTEPKVSSYNTEPHVNSQKSTYHKEPTSLLDSYVPSYLQVQYYKKLQAQSQANQIVNTEKSNSQSTKVKVEKRQS